MYEPICKISDFGHPLFVELQHLASIIDMNSDRTKILIHFYG